MSLQPAHYKLTPNEILVAPFVIKRSQRKSDEAKLLFLSRLVQRSPEEISLVVSELGRPSIAKHPEEPSIDFNISYTNASTTWLSDKQVCLIAATAPASLDTRVGIDVEVVDPTFELSDAMKPVFCPEEIAWVLAAESDRATTNRFFEIWTRKESLLKALGVGLSIEPRAICCLAENNPSVPSALTDEIQLDKAWRIHDLNVDCFNETLDIEVKVAVTSNLAEPTIRILPLETLG